MKLLRFDSTIEATKWFSYNDDKRPPESAPMYRQERECGENCNVRLLHTSLDGFAEPNRNALQESSFTSIYSPAVVRFRSLFIKVFVDTRRATVLVLES